MIEMGRFGMSGWISIYLSVGIFYYFYYVGCIGFYCDFVFFCLVGVMNFKVQVFF